MNPLSGTALSATEAAPLQSRAAAQTSTATAVQGTGVQFSASDFMALLVAEMKNQDPTQPTDPTQYVQQLVSVNSLQQLIQINQGVNRNATTNAV